MKELKNLSDLLRHRVQSLYIAETLQIEAINNMLKQTNNGELKKALQQHVKETEAQKERLEEVGQLLQTDLNGGTEQGIKGLIAEGEEMISIKGSPEALDAAIIAHAQSMEHYEIAAYGTACYIAEELALMPVWEILSRNLQEEKATDQKLNDLAKARVNVRAEKLEQV